MWLTMALSTPIRWHTDIQIPASAAVFTEIPRTQLEIAQTIAVPERQPSSGEVHLSASIANRSDLKRNPPQGPARTAAPAPGKPNFSMLPASSRVFFGSLLHRLHRQMQGAVAARDPFEERPEIESRQKAPFSLEHFHGQFVAVVEDRIDLARQAQEPRGMFVLHPQVQDASSGRPIAGHPYSIPRNSPITPSKTSRNARHGIQAALRASLSLAGLKASVSRGEI